MNTCTKELVSCLALAKQGRLQTAKAEFKNLPEDFKNKMKQIVLTALRENQAFPPNTTMTFTTAFGPLKLTSKDITGEDVVSVTDLTDVFPRLL